MTDPIVSVEHGKLLGKTSQNINEGTFFTFQGIPYAKPPIGNLRFKAPQPPEPWQGIRDATKEGSECFSRDMFFEKIVGSEDCLILNVYTPQLPTKGAEPKPVMVWIHGGAFMHGSSKTDLYGPEFLLTEDIVLVTINYRVGILGFLALEDQSLGVPGNAGLKDMVQALKWVQKNIAKFSGNPNNVTIFGESAGGAAVHYLVLSTTAKGLFNRAICQSGCALNTFAQGKLRTSELAKITKLENCTERELLEYLCKISVEELLQISEQIPQSRGVCDHPIFAPIVEKPSSEAFITEEPIKILNSGNYNQVPLIFGYTSREGMLIEWAIRPLKPQMPRDFELTVPRILGVPLGSDQSKEIAKKIKDFYYGKPEDEHNIDNFYLIHTDNYFLREIVVSVQKHVATSSAPVFLYRMSVESSRNLCKKIGEITAPGVSHADDLGYLFQNTFLTGPIKPGSLEEKSIKRFVKLWTTFAKTSDPNPSEKDELINVKWEPVTDQLNFVDIGENLKADINPEAERIAFWQEIFKINPLYKI